MYQNFGSYITMRIFWENALRPFPALPIFALFFSLLSPAHTSAQGWQTKPVFDNYDFAKSGFPTPDGGYLIAGETGPSDDFHDAYLLKLDPFGNEQWRRTFGGPGFDAVDDMEPTADGGYVLFGTTFSFATGGGSDAWLFKIDRFGEVMWEQVYGGAAFEFGRQVIQTSDGGFAFTGRFDDGADVGILVGKTDADGNEEWRSVFGGAEEDEGWSITENTDNQLVVAGSTRSFGLGERDIYVGIVSQTGIQLGFQTFGGADDDLGTNVITTTDGGLLIAGATRSFGAGDYDVILYKTNADATAVDWQQTYGGSDGEWGAYLAELEDGYALAGSAQSFDNLLDDLYLVRTDLAGGLLWQHTYGGVRKDIPHSLEVLPDGRGFLIAGHSRVDVGTAIETSVSYLVQADADGLALSNHFQGNVFDDVDGDCLFGPGETGFENWLLTARKTDGSTFYGKTNTDGSYSMLVDTGAYTLTLTPPNTYWTPCENALELTLADLDDTLVADFPLQKTIACPDLEVDMATALLRPCQTSTWQVRYCNVGTAFAEGAYVEITLDSFLTFEASGIPPSGQNGLTYRFDLGNLAPGECGGFPLSASLDCDVQMGRTHCLDGHIFPDSICTPTDPMWDGSSVAVSAICEGDSVKFQVKNEGTGDMSEILEIVIVEDQIIGYAANFELTSQAVLEVPYPAFGKTVRLEAGQSAGHPGRSMPSLTVEGCNQSAPAISTGFHTMFPEDDADHFRSLDCRESSPDLAPDEKLAFPKGVDSPHFIRTGSDIEYLIPFQNIGTDTVANVVVRDTLSPFLDLTTLRPGSASHPYHLEVSNTGIVQFTFDNIGLPSEAANEDESRGFIKFRVSQSPDLQTDGIIENRSCVFFDFGAPVAKPQTFHTVEKPKVFSISDVSLCTGGLYDGVVIDGDTTFFDYNELPLADSFSFANIMALPVYDFHFADTSCVNEAYPWQGDWVYAPGVFENLLTTSAGCDSTLTLALEGLPLEMAVADTAVVLGSEFLGQTVFSDTVLLDTVFGKMGCDTMVVWGVSVYTGTADFGDALALNLTPNPTRRFLHLHLPPSSRPFGANLATAKIQVFDVAGREIYSENRIVEKIDLKPFKPGIYFLRVKIGSHLFTKRIIKI